MAVGVHLQNEVLYLNSVKAVDKAFRLGLVSASGSVTLLS